MLRTRKFDSERTCILYMYIDTPKGADTDHSNSIASSDLGLHRFSLSQYFRTYIVTLGLRVRLHFYRYQVYVQNIFIKQTVDIQITATEMSSLIWVLTACILSL